MLPSAVLTQRNGVQLAAFLPEPVTIGRCEQPAFSTAGQQDRPSLTTSLPGAKSRFASLSISRLRKPFTTLSRSRLGRLSGVVSTAATIGVLPAAPRPRLPPGRSPPRWASSTSTRPASFGFSASRAAIARISLCFISQAVACFTPNRRPSSIELIPPLLWVRWQTAANQVVGGGLVAWNTVPAVSGACFLQLLHGNFRRVLSRQKPR